MHQLFSGAYLGLVRDTARLCYKPMLVPAVVAVRALHMSNEQPSSPYNSSALSTRVWSLAAALAHAGITMRNEPADLPIAASGRPDIQRVHRDVHVTRSTALSNPRFHQPFSQCLASSQGITPSISVATVFPTSLLPASRRRARVRRLEANTIPPRISYTGQQQDLFPQVTIYAHSQAADVSVIGMA